MAMILTRRSMICVAGAGGLSLALGQRARAEAKPGRVIYPTAEVAYMSQYVADRMGFFKDAGLDCKMVQGGSGVKMREIVASGQGDIGIGDMSHPMQLSNHGRNARILLPVDIRNASVVFMINKQLADSGVSTLQQFAASKRPDGHKPIIGVSSLGGTNHVWASYYMEQMKLDDQITWVGVGVGDVESMLGSLKTRQIDVLVNSTALLKTATENGWGSLLFDGSGEANWNQYIGGKVPATAHFSLQTTIEQDKPKMQAFVTALWRATQWIKTHSVEEMYAASESFLGSTSRASTSADIAQMKDLFDYTGEIDPASYERGAKVWFREVTGIKPIPMAQIVDSSFALAAKQAHPAG
ncbi:MAG TPA: ABC transporter substrate-binding protein [Aliidongia sp.]|uniref:ABC transporter substrate-binding protein n=1 Tax=Aliidongia sp. TaxID=1914230 RepID=UPI002DDCAB4B|nr:ABC transporter substrate-binding protein [Aliidongia sp.]HEV2676747.1 ABC transporter substrate-binding protein [Aliidongia sp.]